MVWQFRPAKYKNFFYSIIYLKVRKEHVRSIWSKQLVFRDLPKA